MIRNKNEHQTSERFLKDKFAVTEWKIETIALIFIYFFIIRIYHKTY